MGTDVFEFKYSGDRRALEYKFIANTEDTHYEIVEQFLGFLGTVYGYDLREEYLNENSAT